MTKEYGKGWREELPTALWAHRTAKSKAISPFSYGLLIFEDEGSENFAKLDLKPYLTPMVLCLERILSFKLKKKKIRKR